MRPVGNHCVIISTYFDGDHDHEMKNLQHEVYNQAISQLASRCREYHIAAAKLICDPFEYKSAVAGLDTFDHRCLQAAHDHLAAHWRMSVGAVYPVLPGLRNERLAQREWLDWLHHEVERWRDECPHIVRAVCDVLANENRPAGYRAEAQLKSALAQRYPLYWPDNATH